MGLLVPHAMQSYSCTDGMPYCGKKVNHNGSLPAACNGTVPIDLQQYRQGSRVQFRLNGNSTKFYDQAYSSYGSVLRGAETTLNKVEDFRVYRPKEGGPEDDLQWRKMRQGIADLHRRTEVSGKANARLLDALASVDDSRRVEELTGEIQPPATCKGRRVRARHPWGDDKPLLTAVHRGEFLMNGFRNRDLQPWLYSSVAESPTEKRRRAAAISRKLRRLPAHGLIQKVGHTHRYLVTTQARAILVAILTTAQTSVQQLNRIGKAA